MVILAYFEYFLYLCSRNSNYIDKIDYYGYFRFSSFIQ